MNGVTEALTLLLVDDDVVFRERLARALAARGFVPSTAGDVPSALALAEAAQFVGAVIDLKLPGQGGLELIAPLRRLQPGARLLVLTGYGSIATALQAVRLGAADYLTKPADADQIVAALRGTPITPASDGPAVPSLDRLEWEHIQRVLADTGGNISESARLLGIDRRSLQRKLAKFPPQR
jgi:two-component system response regulator RegA